MTILQEADALINGDRAEAYGDAKENLQRVADMWTSYLEQRYPVQQQVNLTAEDVCWMMALLKMCRQMYKHSDENIRDAAGYIGLVEKVRGVCSKEASDSAQRTAWGAVPASVYCKQCGSALVPIATTDGLGNKGALWKCPDGCVV